MLFNVSDSDRLRAILATNQEDQRALFALEGLISGQADLLTVSRYIAEVRDPVKRRALQAMRDQINGLATDVDALRAVNVVRGPKWRRSAARLLGAGGLPRGAQISRFWAGNEELVNAPSPARVIDAGGDVLFQFDAVTPTVTGTGTGTISLTADYRLRAPSGRMLTCTGAGSLGVSHNTTGLGLPTYDHNRGYVLTIYNGKAGTGITNGFSISLNGASGRSQSWTVSGTGFKPGWNTIYLCAVNDAVARGDTGIGGYGSQSGVVQVGTTGSTGMNGQAITSINLTFFANVSVGDFFVIDRLETATKVRPAVVFTYDQAYTDINPNSGVTNPFLNEVIPAFQAAGLVGSCRYHHQIDQNAQGLANVQAAVAAGWDVNNGTLTRVTPVTTASLVNTEYGTNGDHIVAAGFPRPIWGSPPGNNTNTNTETLKSAMNAVGIRFSKGNQHKAIYHGVQGYGNQMSIGVTNLDGLTGAQISSQIDSAIAAGTHLVFFSHYPQGAQTVAELASGLSYAATKKAAGQIDVLTLTQFADVLDGKR